MQNNLSTRALNIDDLNHYNAGEDIYCSLLNSCDRIAEEIKIDKENKKLKKLFKYFDRYYSLHIKGKKEYSLDTIIGHVGGQKLEKKTSIYLSAAPFSIVAREYSIEQAGRYNFQKGRKPIIVFEVQNLKRDVNDIKRLRSDTTTEEFSIDLRNNNLEKLFQSGAISAEKYNKDMPGYDVEADIDKEDGKQTSVSGFSNFATAVEELLIYKKIKKEDIKVLLSPEIVDILYSCKYDINNNLNFLINNADNITEDIKAFNTRFIGKNIVDYIDEYSGININVEDLYHQLKKIKTSEMIRVVDFINKKYHTNLMLIGKLLDDDILVRKYENIGELSLLTKNDLLIIEKNHSIYTFDHSKKGYYNESLNETITTKEVVEIIEKTKKIK